eukprot:5829163-Prymnesium_polylepis.1
MPCGRALGARARAHSLRGDACLCALATVQLEEHVLNIRDRRRVDLLVDADGRHSVARKSGSGSMLLCWRFRWNV